MHAQFHCLIIALLHYVSVTQYIFAIQFYQEIFKCFINRRPNRLDHRSAIA